MPETKPDATGTTQETKPDAAGTPPETKPDAAGTTPETKPDAAEKTPETKPDAAGKTPETKPDAAGKDTAEGKPEAVVQPEAMQGVKAAEQMVSGGPSKAALDPEESAKAGVPGEVDECVTAEKKPSDAATAVTPVQISAPARKDAEAPGAVDVWVRAQLASEDAGQKPEGALVPGAVDVWVNAEEGGSATKPEVVPVPGAVDVYVSTVAVTGPAPSPKDAAAPGAVDVWVRAQLADEDAGQKP